MTLSTERLSMTLEACANELATIRAQRDDLLAACEGAISHNNALKDQFKLPLSLMWQINAAIAKAKGA